MNTHEEELRDLVVGGSVVASLGAAIIAALLLSGCGGAAPAPVASPTAPAPTVGTAPGAAPGFYAGPVVVRFISYYESLVASVQVGDLTVYDVGPLTGTTLGTLPAVGVYPARVVFADGAVATGHVGLWGPTSLVVAFP